MRSWFNPLLRHLKAGLFLGGELRFCSQATARIERASNCGYTASNHIWSSDHRWSWPQQDRRKRRVRRDPPCSKTPSQHEQAAAMQCDARVRSLSRTDWFARCNVRGVLTTVARGEAIMHEEHRKAAEQHELAAQAHRTAAEHNEKGDGAGGSWHAERALEHSDHAYKLAKAAHEKSSQIEAL